MSNISNQFDIYASAANTLKDVFSDKLEILIRNDSDILFSFESEIPNCGWLKSNLIRIIKNFCPAEFDIKVGIEVEDFVGGLSFTKEADDISESVCNFSLIKQEEPKSVHLPSTEAKVIFDSLKEKYYTDIEDIRFIEIYSLLESLEKTGVKITLNIKLLINKYWINNKLLEEIAERDRSHIIAYFFASSYISALRDGSFSEYERKFYIQNKRTIIIIFDLQCYIKNDFLTVLGRDNAQNFDREFADSIPETVVEEYKKILDLRKSHGDFGTNLIPEIFNIKSDN